jgi:hypothetical protein
MTVSIYYFVGVATVVFAAISIEAVIAIIDIYVTEDASNAGVNQVETVGYT